MDARLDGSNTNPTSFQPLQTPSLQRKPSKPQSLQPLQTQVPKQKSLHSDPTQIPSTQLELFQERSYLLEEKAELLHARVHFFESKCNAISKVSILCLKI
jgi:hypothetical protein